MPFPRQLRGVCDGITLTNVNCGKVLRKRLLGVRSRSEVVLVDSEAVRILASGLTDDPKWRASARSLQMPPSSINAACFTRPRAKSSAAKLRRGPRSSIRLE